MIGISILTKCEFNKEEDFTMTTIKLICLTQGKKKDSNTNWYRVTLLGHNSAGKPITGDFFIPEELGEKLVKDNLIEDVLVNVTFDFDDYLRPSITGISRASTSSKAV